MVRSFRSDPEDEKNILYLEKVWNVKNSSQVLKKALKDAVAYAKEQEQESVTLLESLTRSGFVSSFEGEEDLSQTYKDKVKESIKKKFESRN